MEHAGSELVEHVAQLLRNMFTTVTVVEEDHSEAADPARRPGRLQAALTLSPASGGYGRLVVDARQRFEPKDVGPLVEELSSPLRNPASTGLLIVAPALSGRTRGMLRDRRISFVDLQGHAWVRMESPALSIDHREPLLGPERAEKVPGLTGPAGGRVVRALVDVAPPHRIGELAARTGTTPGHVSRLVGALEREALLRRGARGAVVYVDWASLIKAWASSYSPVWSNRKLRRWGPGGPNNILSPLLEQGSVSGRWALTGSHGARGFLHTPQFTTSLILYAEHPETVAAMPHLNQAGTGDEVLIVRPWDEVVFRGCWARGRVPVVAPSQLTADCLSGPPGLTHEGHALLAWMGRLEATWRAEQWDQECGPQVSEQAQSWP